ncbi:MAG: tetratricopeptide repeat protein [Verrucomicrobia bacterium]|jgi:tetratricopeptide (TPR) repeat protein|nr:tetratricopeptide repeat protein [Verrucomicrobiota bacterium]
MKRIFLPTILLGVMSVMAEEKPVPNAAAKPASESAAQAEQAPAQDIMPNQQAFMNLAEERRKDFITNLNEANRLFQQKRIFETLEQLQKAEAIFKDSPEIYNLSGSCYVEMRSFDKALEDFNKALSLSKDNPSIRFNIAEVYFVTHEWQKAIEVFEKVLKELPSQSMALSRLIEFKILLCKNKLGKKDEVLILAEKYDFLDDSPYYYYAKAALEYEANNLVKAEEWIATANRIFQDPNVLAPWQDTLVEYGYIKSFYGGDGSSEAE